MTTRADGGGPAFGGMSLRDWFAGQALVAIGGEFLRQKIAGNATGSAEDMAQAVYLLADAMIKAREDGQ